MRIVFFTALTASGKRGVVTLDFIDTGEVPRPPSDGNVYVGYYRFTEGDEVWRTPDHYFVDAAVVAVHEVGHAFEA
jgi:hypothetical protein